MYGYEQPPPPKSGPSALTIILAVLGVLVLLAIGVCVALFFYIKREATRLVGEAIDGGGLVMASPAAVTSELAGAKKAYVGSWKSAHGSTLDIDASGYMDYEKDEDGDGNKESIKAPIAAFHGDDMEVKLVVTLTVHVTGAPHKVGDTWEMTADRVTLTREVRPGE
jgi:hypothetical protein